MKVRILKEFSRCAPPKTKMTMETHGKLHQLEIYFLWKNGGFSNVMVVEPEDAGKKMCWP